MIAVCVTSREFENDEYFPTYADGKRTFYWGDYEDSPLPEYCVWVLTKHDTTEELAFKAAQEYLGVDEDDYADEEE